ncbi:hypothetical protein BEWA_006860 [Theileria equi strain WA]|uniref:Uncharacterized protein n=1 Tax=Theileria equi strain WA TaxID=1537102 RepID=L0B093_THEEQ|nr:hypothetical protein BEWA_006860 [Theileria equi strain WA]AFZ81277.1 hypothetical protein BEWA_006860 [Theileria equi strain WA]|eukprot:XP_004830943.1 hypothetical protein BEWA_006860 [Theileria equi strain WA]
MKGEYYGQVNSSIVTPKQFYPEYCEFNQAPQSEFKCVSYIPSQEGGLMVNDNYNFSDGYSIDQQAFQHPVPVHTVIEANDHNWQNVQGTQFEGFYGQESNIVPNGSDLNRTNGVEGVSISQGLTNPFPAPEFDQQTIPFTPGFFASNAAFKRIPLNPGKSIFRRRRPGDCVSEWSNAFNNDFDELQNPYCCSN